MDLYFCILCFSLVSSTIFFFQFLSSVKRRIQNYLKNKSQRRSSHHFSGDMIFIMQGLMERLRSVVSLQGWDYCVVWKLSQDHRFLDRMCCCCSGTGNTQNGGDQELVFPVSRVILCRDTMFHHPRTNSCHFLDQLPSSIPLDSGIYADTLLSNQPTWLGFNNNADSSLLEPIGTRVLIPIPGALVEFFVSKKVSEDQQVIDFITAQCNISLDEDMLINHLDYNSIENQKKNDIIFQGSQDSFLWDKEMNSFKCTVEDGINEAQNMHIPLLEPLLNKEQQDDDDKDQIKHGQGRLESLSDCSNNEDDAKYGRRPGQGPTSKNLDAERRRRKKLNERLYNLRGLVPKISKMDKASILGDAIEFVKELKKQAKELQDELEQHSDDEGAKINGINGNKHNTVQGIMDCINGVNLGSKNKNDMVPNNFEVGKSCNGSISKQYQDSTNANDKAQQMEPSVEVGQTDGNEFFVKVFCEHKPGGFVRLIEALNYLGLEITDANVTCFRLLVSNVFKVKKKSSDIVQAHQVRDFLLELMRNPSFEMAKLSENNSGLDMSHPHYQHINSYHPQNLLH